MITIVDKYFNDKTLCQTVDSYRELSQKYNPTQYLNYLGINFDEKGIYSIKFYFHLYKILDEQDVLRFLPTQEHYFKYIDLYYGEHNQGCAFELKFYRDRIAPTYGFHYKLVPNKKSFDAIGYPQNLNPLLLDYSEAPAINFEYYASSYFKKVYYYFRKEEHKTYFAGRFNYSFLKEASFIEYAESDIFSKINIWFGHNISAIPNDANLFDSQTNQFIDKVSKKYGISPMAYGYYEKQNIKAIYFFKHNDIKNPSNSNIFS